MALSTPVVSFTAQHFVECGTEECEGNYQFYCNSCERPMCSLCRDEHLKSSKTDYHDVVSHKHRKRQQLPVEKCKIHPSKDLDILCEECNVPLCSKCSTMPSHRGHTFVDLEEKYAENCHTCQETILKICQYFIPESQNLQKKTNDDVPEVKSVLDGIRSLMRVEATALKDMVDEVTSEKIDHVNEIEESLTEFLKSQDGIYSDYISYLNKLIKEFRCFLSLSEYKNNPLIFSISEALKIKPIPDTSKPVVPKFTAGQYTKDDIVKLLGRIDVPNIEPENRKIHTIETLGRQSKPTERQDRKTSEVKQTLLSSVKKVGEFIIPGVRVAFHVSPDKSGRLWVSDLSENLVQTDAIGNQIQKIQTSGGFGYHSVTQEGNLIYADRYNQVINTVTLAFEIVEFINTGKWTPLSIHSSNINGDILVGLRKDGNAKVARYNKTGEEIKIIERSEEGQELYDFPYYITENITGDVCTSDINRHAVVVVTNAGQYRFSYTGQKLRFIPYGLCTDTLGNILVCDGYSKTVHLLDQDGHFLSLILTEQQGVCHPFCVCVVDESKLHLCQDNTVVVYKFLQ